MLIITILLLVIAFLLSCLVPTVEPTQESKDFSSFIMGCLGRVLGLFGMIVVVGLLGGTPALVGLAVTAGVLVVGKSLKRGFILDE